MKSFPCEIRRVDCERLIPVLSVFDTEAHKYILMLEMAWPGDYLVFERKPVGRNGDAPDWENRGST